MSETITGTLDAVTEKGDWTTFEINVGTQYPIRLSTKVPELIELGRAAKGQLMDWTYNAVEGKINEKSGKPYINRYFEGVAPPSQADASGLPDDSPNANASPSSAPQVHAGGNGAMTKEEWARKDSAIHKMACIKTAADALKHTVPSDPTPEDLTKFLTRVTTLTMAWHRSVLAERDDPTGEDIPFD